MLLFIALSAIIAPFLFLVVLRMSAAKGMALSSIIVILLALTIWGMEGKVILASIFQGIHKTFTILWILFGALVLLNTLRNTGGVVRINQGFQSISADMRVQVVIVAFLFGSLIEGAAGFGTPAMVTGPLLLALGFQPLVAATIALIADSTAVMFGAVGTPVAVGLSNIPSADINFFKEIAVQVTSLDLLAGVFIPFILMVVLTTFSRSSIKDALQMFPWTFLIGIVYTGSAFLIANFFGHEFVSILASLITLIVATLTAKRGILLPKGEWKKVMRKDFKIVEDKAEMGILTAWAPYIIVVVLLLLTRVIPGLKQFALTAIDLTWTDILGVQGIVSKWEFLYSPGTILTLAAVFAFLIQRKSYKTFLQASKESLGTMKITAISLIATLAMVQVFVNSGLNLNNLNSMPEYIAESLASSLGSVWIFVAPFLGKLGAFITGSATVSTLTFSPIQYNVAQAIGLNLNTVLAVQLIGAAAGNMICVHNVVAASAVVGLSGKEGEIIRKTLGTAVVYVVLAGIAGFLFLNVF
ncbi:L-lactate permease [Priestia flexa]|uniref:L-lactate permease n=1 Tax=Priestia flexa TaxID=86664 RepID=UPI001CD56448|nr:L-lactate permease [Priestia flexa]MCA1203553.1 L-lactate permease [Priestia flexa]